MAQTFVDRPDKVTHVEFGLARRRQASVTAFDGEATMPFSGGIFEFPPDRGERTMNRADIEIRKGLAGVVVDTTSISTVVEESNSLTYRGYPVQELAESCSFEEVAWLIWYGELPGRDALRRFQKLERTQRDLSPTTLSLLGRLPETCHPMDALRTGVSCLGTEDPAGSDTASNANLATAVNLFAKLPTIVAFDFRRRQGLDPIPPNPQLDFVENFFHMCFGRAPDSDIARCFEISLILYAEHGFNASTFTARVVASTLSDMYSAVTAAIGALKGPLHGGANEAVMRMMLEIDDPKRADQWLREALAAKTKVMGFGHRVYKHGDSRVPTAKGVLSRVAEATNGHKWLEMCEILEQTMLAEKGIHPNLDFPTGPAYYLMGFDIPMFTSIFVVSRVTGWTAHVIEQLSDNSLVRPLSSYTGPEQRRVPPAAIWLDGQHESPGT
jgi:citrate synthase